MSSESKPPRLVVAGAGAAGAGLARAARLAGWPLGAIACRTRERAVARCESIGGGEPVTLAELSDPAAEPGERPVLLLVAVPDAQIAATAASLAGRRWPEGSCALHLSGSVEVSALEPLRGAGLAAGGMHPLRSFVDVERDAAQLAGTVFAIEGDEPALEVAERLTRAVGARPLTLRPGGRTAWHAAATHACNHFVALLDQSLELMESAGLPRDAARAALLPLLRGTLENLALHAPAQALTGPVVRGDVAVVAGHRRALREVSPDVGEAYRALARRAVELAVRERGLPPETAHALLVEIAP